MPRGESIIRSKAGTQASFTHNGTEHVLSGYLDYDYEPPDTSDPSPVIEQRWLFLAVSHSVAGADAPVLDAPLSVGQAITLTGTDRVNLLSGAFQIHQFAERQSVDSGSPFLEIELTRNRP